MIDREARDILAEDFRHLISGQVTNCEFEERLRESDDAAVTEVFFCGAWPLYDDRYEHSLTGGWAIRKSDWPIAARCILFLKTNLEYEWSETGGFRGLRRRLLSLLTFGLLGRSGHRARRPRSSGDSAVWPFFRAADFEAALKRHPYLNGTEGSPNTPVAVR